MRNREHIWIIISSAANRQPRQVAADPIRCKEISRYSSSAIFGVRRIDVENASGWISHQTTHGAGAQMPRRRSPLPRCAVAEMGRSLYRARLENLHTLECSLPLAAE